jgi:NUMOD3 motif
MLEKTIDLTTKSRKTGRIVSEETKEKIRLARARQVMSRRELFIETEQIHLLHKQKNGDVIQISIDQESLQARFDKFTIPEPNSGCLIWLGKLANEYPSIKVKGYNLRSTRVAMALAGRDVPIGLFCCHSCDVPSCVNVNHLYPGTQSQNMLDAYARDRAHTPNPLGSRRTLKICEKISKKLTGLKPSVETRAKMSKSAVGNKNTKRKLNDEQVREIRTSTLKAVDLAKKYGVACSHIYALRNGEKRKDVK